MDYRRLLWKYMEHVGAMEGITFVGSAASGEHKDDFTEEEIVELNIIHNLRSDYVE